MCMTMVTEKDRVREVPEDDDAQDPEQEPPWLVYGSVEGGDAATVCVLEPLCS